MGSTVTWTNTDSIPHTTTADGGQWNSGVIQPGAQFNFTFSSAGTFAYHCSIHPNMVGTITVQ
ncbi:MAG: plastocyanin/azurin family copper-binding protein [Vicinamibacterales bacterium]